MFNFIIIITFPTTFPVFDKRIFLLMHGPSQIFVFLETSNFMRGLLREFNQFINTKKMTAGDQKF